MVTAGIAVSDVDLVVALHVRGFLTPRFEPSIPIARFHLHAEARVRTFPRKDLSHVGFDPAWARPADAARQRTQRRLGPRAAQPRQLVWPDARQPSVGPRAGFSRLDQRRRGASASAPRRLRSAHPAAETLPPPRSCRTRRHRQWLPLRPRPIPGRRRRRTRSASPGSGPGAGPGTLPRGRPGRSRALRRSHAVPAT